MAVVDQKELYRRHAAVCYDIAATMTGKRATSMLLLGDTYAALAVNPDQLPPNRFVSPRKYAEPLCKTCGRKMQLAHSLSRTKNLPIVQAFWCEVCRQTLTWKGEPTSRAARQRVVVTASKESRWLTHYIALSFRRGTDFAPGPIIECPDAGLAIKRAELMTREKDIAGAVAFSRRSNANSGEFDVAVILEIFGDIPEGFDIA
jgi:hypothetical protein